MRAGPKECWAPKNWCFQTVVLEKILESLLDSKEIKPVNHKGNQSWIFIGRTDAEAEAPILWPPDAKSWLIGKDPDTGKEWRQEEKGMTEDEMIGWHHRLNGHEFEWTPGVGDGQGGLACCGPWVAKSRTLLSDWTEPNWVNVSHTLVVKMFFWVRWWIFLDHIIPFCTSCNGAVLGLQENLSKSYRESPDPISLPNFPYFPHLSVFVTTDKPVLVHYY